MQRKIAYLNPGKKLVEETADWLSDRVIDDASGAKSLARFCVVVPTAQSGRNLRLALARRFSNGLVPPKVVLPMQLAKGVDETGIATRVQSCALFLTFINACGKDGPAAKWPHLFLEKSLEDPDALLSFHDQLEDLWHILGTGGFLMRDVRDGEKTKEILGQSIGDEASRWEELADLEEKFFAFLHKSGLRHEAERLNAIRVAPPAIDQVIKTIVLPALVDAVPVMYQVLEKFQGDVVVLVHASGRDGGKFDEWGRPEVKAWTDAARPDLPLGDGDLVTASKDTALAEKIAKDFPQADAGSARPSLGLCDAHLFAPIAAALSAKGYELHDPEKFRLADSSLGRIASLILSIWVDSPYNWGVFASLMREDDVMRRIRALLNADARKAEKEGAADGEADETAGAEEEDEGEEEDEAEEEDESGEKYGPSRKRILEGLDIVRNTYLPTLMPADCEFNHARFDENDKRDMCTLNRILAFEAAAKKLAYLLGKARKDATSAAGFLRAVLVAIYTRRHVGDKVEEKEFDAAARALRNVISEFDGDMLPAIGLDGGLLTAVLRKSLSDAVYSLEPDSPKALRTEGWLELAWSDADRIVLAGFNEGDVPDSVLGHPFLPESLRTALGLPSNEQRLARDTFLLSSILSSRTDGNQSSRTDGNQSSPKNGNVRAYFARTNDEGDIHKPSRLLFLVPDDRLAVRTKILFGDIPAGGRRPPRIVADDWRPNLPDTVELPHDDDETPGGHLSPSAIDTWLKCPFAYLLKYGLSMDRFEEKDELGADDFGTIVHAVLEHYAKTQMARADQLKDENDIRNAIEKHFDDVRASYGFTESQKLRLQLDAVRERLLNFAPIQAKWSGEGWRIEASEFPVRVRPFEGEGEADVWIKGYVDRIDSRKRDDGTIEYRIIDYKTWDERGKVSGKIITGGAKQIEHAKKAGVPLTGTAKGDVKDRRFLTIQLPLYGRCLEKTDQTKYAGKISDYCYLVLGKDKGNTVVFGSRFDQGEFECQKNSKTILADLAPAALDTAKAAIRAIRANLFWPPGPSDELRYGGLKELFLNSPKSDLEGSEWLARQEKLRKSFSGEDREETKTQEEQP